MSRRVFITKVMEISVEVSDEEIEENELDSDERIIDYAVDCAHDIPSYHWDNDGYYTGEIDDY